MYWYHGSKRLFPTLRKQKAYGPPGTPAEESLEAIYLTPDFAFALACAARPPGGTEINHVERTVRFDNPVRFDPEKEVYIYLVDPSKVPDDKKIWIDKWQVAVHLDEIEPDKVETHKSGEVSRYYNILVH